MLRRHDDSRHFHRDPIFVHDADLGFAIRAKPLEIAVLPKGRETLRQAVGQHDRHRHELIGLIRRVTEHHPLVAGATGIDASGNVGRLPADRADDGAGLVVEAIRGVGITNAFNGLPDNLWNVHVGIGCDLPRDTGKSRGHQRFTRDARIGVIRKDGVEDRIGNGICDLVRMSFRD